MRSRWLAALALVGLLVFPGLVSAETFRDEFNAPAFSNQDGTLNWSADWIEVDGAGAGPTVGNVQTTGGTLSLDDRPNTGGTPGLEREVDVSAFTAAVLSFDFQTTAGVDNSDAVAIEVSANGGGSWTVLETITGISGATSASRVYNVTGFMASNMRVRFRVTNTYGGTNEQFLVDDVQIEAFCGAQTFRDEFAPPASFSNNDGTLNWSADWIEIDPTGPGPGGGNARTNGGVMRIDNRPSSAPPSLAREADLSTFSLAFFSFDFDRSPGVDTSDSIVVEISSNGGGSWTPLENFTGVSGANSGARSYDISAFASATTRIRFRVNNGYTGNNEEWTVDDVEILVGGACGPHFSISHDGGADTCNAEPVTITAHASSHAVDTGYLGTITLSTSTANGDWSLIAGSGTLTNLGNGDGTYTFAVGDAGQVQLGLNNTNVETLNIDVTDGSQSESSSEDPSLIFSLLTTNETVRDDFGSVAYSNQDGSQNWTTDWIEFDVSGPGPAAGNVLVTGGELSLDDFPNTNTDPSLERQADLSTATTAVFSFDFRTSSGVDANDSMFIEVSNNGGATWSLLENIIGITGAVSASRSYDISAFASVNTRVRFRVDGLGGAGGSSCCYGAANENFLVDFAQIQYTTPTACGPDHFVIAHDGAGIHCAPEPVTVTATEAGGGPSTTYNQQMTLDTQTGLGTWSLITGNGVFSDPVPDDGLAIYTYSVTDLGVAVFALNYTQGPSPLDLEVFQSSTPSIRDDDTEGPLTFAASGFTVTASVLSNPPPVVINDPIQDQTAGTDFALHIAAFGTTPTDPSCGVIEDYNGAKALKFWSTYADPATGTIAPTIDGTAIATAEPAAAAQPVVFINGQAVVVAKYKDVGLIQIGMKDDTVAPEIRGGTNPFVVRPADLRITEITRTDLTPNPGASTPAGAVFVAAGTAFRVQLEARDAEGSLTPNYGNEVAAEGILLVSSTLIAPAGGRNGTLNNGAIGNGTSFASVAPAGTFEGTTFYWDEVGAIRLTASVADGDYLGSGDVTGTESGDVGRFIPFDFDVAYNAPRFQTFCPVGAFTYVGQSFDYAAGEQPVLTFTARNAQATTTQNYQGAWFRLAAADLTGLAYAAFSGVLSAAGPNPPLVVDLLNGSGTLTFDQGPQLSFNRTVPVAFFDAEIRLEVNVLDGDGVAFAGNPAAFGQAAVGNGIPFTAGKEMRFGRLRMGNGHDSELLPVAVPFFAEYFTGAAFTPNVADGCTSLSILNLIQTPNPPALPTVPTINNVPLLLGDANLVMSAPGPGGSGFVDLIFDLGPAGANMPWLADDLDSDGNYLENPVGRATFGIFRGDDSMIYLREIY